MHTALCDNFNTPGAMVELLGIASDAFTYLRGNASPDALLLKFSERQGGLRAADLRFLSCYPAEAEHVWPPMTHLQPTGNMEVVRLPALGDAKFTVVEVEPRAASARHTM